MMPSADAVAVAIVAAAREVCPERWREVAVAIVSGEITRGGPQGDVAISRGRTYAAKALDEVFDCGAVAIGRMVGSGLGGGLPFRDRPPAEERWREMVEAGDVGPRDRGRHVGGSG